MIVVCPSCQQRYRHDHEAGATPAQAHCSACDERFALDRPKRAYRVVDAGSPAAAHPGVGSDDPLTGAPPVTIDLPPTAQDATGPDGVGADVPREPDGTEAIAPPPAATAPTAETTVPEAVALPAATIAADEATVPEAIPGPAEKAPPRRETLPEILVALFPCGLGAAMAYHLAGPRGQDPITWAALGGAIGLLLGWACLLWITRGD
jgi:hypothetical protein